MGVVVAIAVVLVVLALTTGLATDVRGLIASVATWVERLFAEYGYPIVFLAVLGESAGLPLPGETILLIAGVAAQHGSLALPVVWLLGAAAAIVGDNLGYLVGHYGGRPLLERYGRILRVHERELRILDRYFEAHGAKTVFLGRWVIFLRVWAALFAGAARMEWKRFFFYNALGGTAWVVSMSSLAYIFSSSISRLKGVFGVVAWVAAFVVAGLVVVFVAREQRRNLEKYAREDEEARGGAAASAGDGPGDGSPPPTRTDAADARPRPEPTGAESQPTQDKGSSPGSAP
jgi:membrane protein DedA with SNARE-associated domain